MNNDRCSRCGTTYDCCILCGSPAWDALDACDIPRRCDDGCGMCDHCHNYLQGQRQ